MAKAPPVARSHLAVLEDLAAQVMAADPADAAAFRKLALLLEELRARTPPDDPAGIRPAAEAEIAALGEALDGAGRGDALAAALDRLCRSVSAMQDAVARSLFRALPQEREAPSGRRLVLPEWADEAILREFAAGQRSALDEIEASILKMERADDGPRAAMKRRLHTLKGDAGVLGLSDMERVARVLEDLLEKAPRSPGLVDRLLKVRDWMAGALDAYGRMMLPEQGAEEVIAEWIAPPVPHGPLTPSPSPTPGPSPSPSPVIRGPGPDHGQRITGAGADPAAGSGMGSGAPAPEERVDRDAETVGLFGEFLSESADGIGRVDEILLDVERAGARRESVDGLFRVFHTIKGTAGFLELTQVVELAHTTEAMLNQCREGALDLEGAVVDLVFDATAAMRTMLDGIRAAVERGAALPPADLGALLRRIQAATRGMPVAEKAAPEAAPGERLGDLLKKLPAAVPAAAIERALEAQAASGKRLGEVLVAEGAARAGDVALALRAQARAAKEAAEAPVHLKETIKVDLERVDSLVETIGELVVVESMVVNAPEIGHSTSVRVRNMLAQLGKVTRDLQDVGMRMRMVPVAGAFQKMARLVRDLSHKGGKRARLATSGEATEMDRSMVEQIADPLVHLIRNCLDHGLEPPEERRARGKPETGVVRLSARHEGGSVVIEVGDDGRGLDRARIVEKAVEMGLVRSAEGMSEEDVDALIFAPGFSTAAEVTEISGRGVGLDVVKRNVETVRGRVMVFSVPGQGTRFRMVLPLTLAIIDGMLVACGGERYIVPTLSIVESLKPERSMLLTLAGRGEMIDLRGEVLPLLRLDRLFGLAGAGGDVTEGLVVVMEGAGRRFGVAVDEVLAQQQVVIKSMGSGLGATPFVSGAAILSDGRVGLILNVEEISARLHRGGRPALHDPRGRPAAAARA